MRRIYCGQDSSAIASFRKNRVFSNDSNLVCEKGEFMHIDKREIYVDESYQRMPGKADAIAKAFSWRAFGIISIAIRENKYIAFDGQHRVEAACMRPDITELPCMVFSSDGAHQEARDFISIQRNRRKVDAIDQFRAKLVAMDEDAMEINNIVISCGYVIARHGDRGNISALSRVEQTYKSTGGEYLRFALNWCSEFYQKKAPGLLINAIAVVEKKMNSKGDSLFNYSEKLSVYEELMREINKTAVMANSAKTYEVHEVAILALINKSRRTRKISL